MEIELGPCAEFSLYHLMDLEPNEQRLSLNVSDGTLEGSLLRGRISTISRGSPMQSRGADYVAPQIDNKPAQQTPKRAQHVDKDTPSQSIQKPQTLSDLCHIIRSKNAGPFEITIDAMFSSEADYQAVKASGLLSPHNVADALGIPEEDIIWIGFFNPAIAFKVTIPRVRSGKKKSAGGFMENDIHGSQEHMGLASLKLPGTDFHL
jgi:hypothetical protein